MDYVEAIPLGREMVILDTAADSSAKKKHCHN
jgi:hypothetical protein